MAKEAQAVESAYDVVVIGSGPGGYVAGIKAARRGMQVLVVEREELGGVCLNWGCIPTKALLRSAELYGELREAEAYGFQVGQLSFDAGKVVARSRGVAQNMNRGVTSLFRKYKVAHVRGEARFASPKRLVIRDAEAPQVEHQVQARQVIIASGVRPRRMPQFPVDGQTVLTYREALVLERLPKSMLIIGGGAIGVEFAYYFNAFGVKVQLVEALPRLLPQEDAEISALLLRAFRRQGIACYPGTQVGGFEARPGQVKAVLQPREGQEESLTCEMALVAVGMEAQVQSLALENSGVALERGFIRVNARMETSVPGIYAIGDATGRQMLAHKASAEAEVAVATIAGQAVQPVDYGQVPACTYCQPQVASIGLTEQACKEQGLPYRVGKFPFLASGKAQAIRQAEGVVKLLFGEPHGQLLGAHLIGPDVTELLAELGLALRLEATAEELLATIHAHPTLSEAVFESTGVAYGESANF